MYSREEETKSAEATSTILNKRTQKQLPQKMTSNLKVLSLLLPLT